MTGLRMLGAAPEPPVGVVAPLAKGFRPFFLLAALHAVGFIPIWLLALSGNYRTGGYLAPWMWHAHEMVFGFATAVIAGFLLTAAGNWTGRETAVGGRLAALAALWMAGRFVFAAAAWLPSSVIATVDLAFLPALAFAVGRVLIATGSRRNYPILAAVSVLWFANLAMHLDALGVAAGWSWRVSRVAVELVVLLVLMIGSRVIPMFTKNATGAGTVRNIPALDRATLVAMAALIVVDVAWPGHRAGAIVAGLAAVLAAARSTTWGARHTLRNPLLWILHAAHAWIVVGLALRALGAFVSALAPAGWVHALTMGGIGCATLGMMARVALGHTGRPLVMPRPMTVAFVALVVATVIRVAGPFWPAHYTASLRAAGTGWTIAFGLYIIYYARILMRPRADGKPG